MSTSYRGCGHCTRPAAGHCARCGNIRYCSRECQRADWHIHKTLCASFQNFLSRPSPLHRRAIIFREHAATPDFVWIRVHARVNEPCDDVGFSDEHGITFIDPSSDIEEEIQFDSLFDFPGTQDRVYARYVWVVMGNLGNGQQLDHTIHAWHRENFIGDGSVVNACLNQWTEGETGQAWRGPIVFVGKSKAEDSPVYRDLDTADLTIALQGMKEYAKKARLGLKYFLQ